MSAVEYDRDGWRGAIEKCLSFLSTGATEEEEEEEEGGGEEEEGGG